MEKYESTPKKERKTIAQLLQETERIWSQMRKESYPDPDPESNSDQDQSDHDHDQHLRLEHEGMSPPIPSSSSSHFRHQRVLREIVPSPASVSVSSIQQIQHSETPLPSQFDANPTSFPSVSARNTTRKTRVKRWVRKHHHFGKHYTRMLTRIDAEMNSAPPPPPPLAIAKSARHCHRHYERNPEKENREMQQHSSDIITRIVDAPPSPPPLPSMIDEKTNHESRIFKEVEETFRLTSPNNINLELTLDEVEIVDETMLDDVQNQFSHFHVQPESERKRDPDATITNEFRTGSFYQYNTYPRVFTPLKSGINFVEKKKKYNCTICAKPFKRLKRCKLHEYSHMSWAELQALSAIAISTATAVQANDHSDAESNGKQNQEQMPNQNQQKQTGTILDIESPENLNQLQAPRIFAKKTSFENLNLNLDSEINFGNRETNPLLSQIQILEQNQDQDHCSEIQSDINRRNKHRKLRKTFPLLVEKGSKSKSPSPKKLNRDRDRDSCHFCGKRFSSPVTLCRHLQHDHDHTEGDTYKGYKCSVCPWKFRHRYGLVRHERIHLENGGREYPCSFCDKSFNRKDNRAQHERRMHGESNTLKFACVDCGAEFRYGKNLKEHRNTVHLKLRPCKCPKCERSFGRKVDLTKHLKNVHK